MRTGLHAPSHGNGKMKASPMIFGKHISLSPLLLARSLVHRIRNDSLLRNSIYIMATTVATSAIGYLYWIVATHIYSAPDVGLTSALSGFMALSSTLANMGIGATLIQTLPRRASGYAWSLTLNAGLATGTVTSLLAGIIAVVVLPLFSHQFAIVWHNAAYALIFIAGVPLFTIATLLDQAFVAERATSNLLGHSIAYALLRFPLMVLFAPLRVLGIFSSSILALVVTLIGTRLLLVPRLGRAYCFAVRGMMEQVRGMLSSLVGHHFINIGGLMPMYLLPVLVTVKLSATDNAYFYTTSMVGSIFFMISPAVATSLFAEGSHGADDVLRKVRNSALITGLLLGPAMLIMFLVGRYVLLLFGPRYAEHGQLLLMILVADAVPDAITNIYVSVLRVQGRLRTAAILNLSMAALTLVLAWILLPILGIVGAGWAYLIAQLTGSLIAGIDFLSRRWLRGRGNGPIIQSDLARAENAAHAD